MVHTHTHTHRRRYQIDRRLTCDIQIVRSWRSGKKANRIFGAEALGFCTYSMEWKCSRTQILAAVASVREKLPMPLPPCTFCSINGPYDNNNKRQVRTWTRHLSETKRRSKTFAPPSVSLPLARSLRRIPCPPQILNNIIYHEFLMEFVVIVRIICQRAILFVRLFSG